MKNIEQLLNKKNWIKYLELADEGGITNHGKAQDIVSKIEKAINYNRCCETLPCSYAEGYNDAIAKIKEEAKYIDKQ